MDGASAAQGAWSAGGRHAEAVRYRPDVDGLRAVAVIAVLLFHAGFLGGGFVGVDVFFVISGYLITRIILAEREAPGGFSYLDFYERRVRRLLPALFVVTAATLLAGAVLLPPGAYAELGEVAAAAALFVSNILFHKTQNYFAGATELNPLIHYWSLSVEEQFYLIYPTALLLLWRAPPWARPPILWTVALLSLAAAQLGGNFKLRPPFLEDPLFLFNQPSWAAFFLPTGRAWEFLAGALAALRPASALARRDGWLSALGLALILGSVIVIDEEAPSPSIVLLPPVVGAYLLLAHGRAIGAVGRALSWRPLVGVGLVSYSLYLWHQPVLALARVSAGRDLSTLELVGLLALSLALAILTWRFVEQPARRRGAFSRRLVFAGGAVASVAILVAGLAVTASDGFMSRYPAGDHDLLASHREREAYVVGSDRPDGFRAYAKTSAFVPDGGVRVVVIGDSYSQDFINIAVEGGAFDHAQVKAIYAPAICQIYLGDEDVSEFEETKDLAYCAQARRQIESARPFVAKADLVILAANWRRWAVDRLPETLETLGVGDTPLAVVGLKNFGSVRPERYLGATSTEKAAVRLKISGQIRELNGYMAERISPGEFVDVIGAVCGSSDTCPTFTPQGKLISYDGGHLTPAGARFLASLLLDAPALAPLKD